MKDYISDINRFYESKSNSSLYSEWLYYNSSLYMRYFVLIALAVTSILIPFDFLLYDSPLLYSSVRVVMMTVFIVMLVIVFKYYNNKNMLLIYLNLSKITKKKDWEKFIYYWLDKKDNLEEIKKNLNEFKKSNDKELIRIIESMQKNIT